MRGRVPNNDFIEPMILNILKETRVFMSALAINYRVNEATRRTIDVIYITN